MSDYKQMYYKLFNRITEIIEELKEIQQQAEEMYISNSDNKISIISSDKNHKP